MPTNSISTKHWDYKGWISNMSRLLIEAVGVLGSRNDFALPVSDPLSGQGGVGFFLLIPFRI